MCCYLPRAPLLHAGSVNRMQDCASQIARNWPTNSVMENCCHPSPGKMESRLGDGIERCSALDLIDYWHVFLNLNNCISLPLMRSGRSKQLVSNVFRIIFFRLNGFTRIFFRQILRNVNTWTQICPRFLYFGTKMLNQSIKGYKNVKPKLD